MSWWEAMFSADVVRKKSSLGLVLSRREGIEATQCQIQLRCENEQAMAQTTWRYPDTSTSEEAALPLDAYVSLWEAIVASGWVALAMSGDFKAGDGTDLYFEAGVGPDGLGWVFSTRMVRVRETPELRALFELILGFARDHAPGLETNRDVVDALI